jgi:two-component system chemotaxis response regulator CheY
MVPLCLVPVVITLSEARRNWVEQAMRLGAHSVIAKPLSPNQLIARIKWVMAGNPKLKLAGERYVIEGVEERLAVERERHNQLAMARAYQESQFAEMATIQNDVDKLLQSAF